MTESNVVESTFHISKSLSLCLYIASFVSVLVIYNDVNCRIAGNPDMSQLER